MLEFETGKMRMQMQMWVLSLGPTSSASGSLSRVVEMENQSYQSKAINFWRY